MSKRDAILRYQAAMAMFRKWSADGMITEAERREMGVVLAKKYGLSLCSIFLGDDLLSPDS